MTKVSKKSGVQQLVNAFKQHEVKHIVFSPGSRNAPLVISYANDEYFKTYVIPDERSAAFFALGISEQLNQPVALMCTSGSALLNYYPAISEAFYRNIPLIVVSADRPNEWIDQGDGQTIRQQNVFQNHVHSFYNLLEQPQNKNQYWHNQRMINESLIVAKQTHRGPVHFNFPFTEPLYEVVEETTLTRENQFKNTTLLPLDHQFLSPQKKALQEIWNQSKKRLILCGQLPKNSYLQELLKRLAKDKSVAVVVENISNLYDQSFVHCIDRTINSFLEENPTLYQPDLLITIGGAIVSKKIKKYLRDYSPKTHWKVGEDFPLMDTFQSLTTSIPVAPTALLEVITEDESHVNVSRYGEQWKQLDYLAEDEHFNFLQTAPYSDLSVFDFILDAVPDQSVLHLANSSVIRYTQLFNPIRTITYQCNRGTSGIDGSMSTAVGSTVVDENRVHTLITGDLSFFYDSNALWNQYVPTNFRIILINNGGGDIFNIIPGPDTTSHQQNYFVTEQKNYAAKGICAAFQINYYKASSLEEIDRQLDVYFEIQDNDRPALLEIFTDKANNAEVLKNYFEKIKVKNAPILKLD